jgi:hypothetical protein
MKPNKRKHVELGMLSPFSRAAKKSPTHPIQCCGRYNLKNELKLIDLLDGKRDGEV